MLFIASFAFLCLVSLAIGIGVYMYTKRDTVLVPQLPPGQNVCPPGQWLNPKSLPPRCVPSPSSKQMILKVKPGVDPYALNLNVIKVTDGLGGKFTVVEIGPNQSMSSAIAEASSIPGVEYAEPNTNTYKAYV